MAATSDTVRILLIRAWTEPLAPLREALRDARIAARITRIDIEPALHAALGRSDFDVVVYDPKTPKLTREVVDQLLRDHRRSAPVITFVTVTTLVDYIQRVLAERLN